ncbi:hypothetical protein GCM10022215_06360 [Nocardioides fonticola]|uniref:Peptidase C11 n=1 Tax=Nocardioides fonticola TaxID=450363 RepID=A0ABP7XD04_9ACTN
MTRRRRPALILAALVSAAACSLAACGSTEEDSDEETRSHTGREGEGWTVLHYSMADTNLETFMVDDVNELGQVATGDDVAIREFMDRSPEYGDDEVLDQGAWVGGRVLDLGGEGTSELVEDLGDVNSADPEVLADFIAQGIEDHRAGHYALIISDHGASWPGIGPDETSGDVLDLAEITNGIRDGLDRAGVDVLDLIGFDACLMSGYEVASAMAPLADRMVASQELEPGHGWDYGAFQVLADEPGADVDTLGQAILDGFRGQAREQGTDDEITLALTDLTKMGEVEDAVDTFAQALADRVADVAPVVGRVEASTLGFAKNPDPTQDAHLVDLGQLVAGIGTEALDVSDEADAVIRALGDAVLAQVGGAATQGASGLSVYFPPTQDLADGAYLDVDSAEDWGDFLTAYYDAGEQIPDAEQPSFTNEDGVAEVDFTDDGVDVYGTYDGAAQDNLVDATISYAIADPDGTLTYFGEEAAVVDPEGDPIATGSFDLTALTISDGEDTAYAYLTLDFSDDLSTGFVDVPMTYYAADDPNGEYPMDVLLSIVLDVDSGDFISETYYVYDEETGGYGELDADPDGIVVPDVYTVSPDGEGSWEPTSDVGLYADLAELTYDIEPLDSGTPLQLDLTVTDFGGNQSTVSALVEVP